MFVQQSVSNRANQLFLKMEQLYIRSTNATVCYLAHFINIFECNGTADFYLSISIIAICGEEMKKKTFNADTYLIEDIHTIKSTFIICKLAAFERNLHCIGIKQDRSNRNWNKTFTSECQNEQLELLHIFQFQSACMSLQYKRGTF